MNRFLVALAAAALSLMLSGCISLFPKSVPAQLYRFGALPTAASSSSSGVQAQGARPEIIKGIIQFNQAAAGDRLLTVNGPETAYIAGSRWISPATTLFDEALDRAFAAAPNAPRLTEFGRGGKGAALLRVEVDTFETRYEQGMEAAPTVVVRVQASLLSTKDRSVIGETTIESRKPASDNRVGPIVQAYDAATGEVIGQLIAWTAGKTASIGG